MMIHAAPPGVCCSSHKWWTWDLAAWRGGIGIGLCGSVQRAVRNLAKGSVAQGSGFMEHV